MLLSEVFDAVYVINLKNRLDRLKEVQAQLRQIGVEIDEKSIKLFSAIKPSDRAGFPTVGSRGCFLSHLEILKLARRDHADKLLILEDDADFSPDFQQRFDKMSRILVDTEWSFFIAGWLAADPAMSGEGLLTLPPTTGVMGTHMIGVRGDAIAELVDYLEAMLERPTGDPSGGPMHVDGAYFWYRRSHPNRRAVISIPPLAVQRPSRTDVHALRWFDRIPVVSSAASVARKLKSAMRRYGR